MYMITINCTKCVDEILRTCARSDFDHDIGLLIPVNVEFGGIAGFGITSDQRKTQTR
jgi:hypothetical protein